MRFSLLLTLTLSLLSPLSAADAPAYRVLGADNGKVALVDSKGAVEWEYANKCETHDLWLLPNGNVLLPLGRASVGEVNRQGKIVWRYDSQPKAGYTGGVEVHAFQPLPVPTDKQATDKPGPVDPATGSVMIAESGNARIIEVNRQGDIVKEFPLTVEHPNAHRDTRMARKLKNGHYLVCHEGDGAVREYDTDGQVVWTFRLDLGGRPAAPGHGPEGHGTSVYGAVRLDNGHTLIAGGNNNRVLEVNPEGKIVWSLGHNELPGIRLAWVTTLHVLPNGHIIVGNCHAGPDNPQLFEVDREKHLLWTFKNFKTFGNGLAATQVLDTLKPVLR